MNHYNSTESTAKMSIQRGPEGDSSTDSPQNRTIPVPVVTETTVLSPTTATYFVDEKIQIPEIATVS